MRLILKLDERTNNCIIMLTPVHLLAKLVNNNPNLQKEKQDSHEG